MNLGDQQMRNDSSSSPSPPLLSSPPASINTLLQLNLPNALSFDDIKTEGEENEEDKPKLSLLYEKFCKLFFNQPKALRRCFYAYFYSDIDEIYFILHNEFLEYLTCLGYPSVSWIVILLPLLSIIRSIIIIIVITHLLFITLIII
jgi:hypothetical protein